MRGAVLVGIFDPRALGIGFSRIRIEIVDQAGIVNMVVACRVGIDGGIPSKWRFRSVQGKTKWLFTKWMFSMHRGRAVV